MPVTRNHSDLVHKAYCKAMEQTRVRAEAEVSRNTGIPAPFRNPRGREECTIPPRAPRPRICLLLSVTFLKLPIPRRNVNLVHFGSMIYPVARGRGTPSQTAYQKQREGSMVLLAADHVNQCPARKHSWPCLNGDGAMYNGKIWGGVFFFF